MSKNTVPFVTAIVEFAGVIFCITTFAAELPSNLDTSMVLVEGDPPGLFRITSLSSAAALFVVGSSDVFFTLLDIYIDSYYDVTVSSAAEDVTESAPVEDTTTRTSVPSEIVLADTESVFVV